MKFPRIFTVSDSTGWISVSMRKCNECIPMENVINVQWRNQYAARRFYLVVILDATIVVVSSFKICRK